MTNSLHTTSTVKQRAGSTRAHTQICAPRLPQLALPPLLPSLRPDLLSSARALTSLRALFAEVLDTVPGWTIAAAGAYFAYVSFPAEYIHASSALGLKRRRLGSMEIAKELVERLGVVCLPGRFFAPDLEEVEEVQERLIRSARDQGSGAGIATTQGNGGMSDQERVWWGKLKEDRWLRCVSPSQTAFTAGWAWCLLPHCVADRQICRCQRG